jgi:hypothetical protein
VPTDRAQDTEAMTAERRYADDQARKFRAETELSNRLAREVERLKEALEAIKFVTDNTTSDDIGLADVEGIAVAALAGESVAHRLEPALYTALMLAYMEAGGELFTTDILDRMVETLRRSTNLAWPIGAKA